MTRRLCQKKWPREIGAFVVVVSLWTIHAITGCDDDASSVDRADGASPVDAPSKPLASENGLPCAAGTECQSGSCADSVCCNAKCDGICEKCSLEGTVGVCTPIASGLDPDNECPVPPREDAGSGSPNVDAGADAETILDPDGGVILNDTRCKGSCNGQRACAYPNGTVTCGAKFCNTTSEQGRASCDGTGRCNFALEACQAYGCETGSDAGMPALGNQCKTSCTSDDDCLPTHTCNQGNKQCEPKHANGTACTSVTQCQSGHCTVGQSGSGATVCCNDECQVAGGSCTSVVVASPGQCACSACTTGACKLWFIDRDGDGHGDRDGTIANGGALMGCATGLNGNPPAPPAAGFVESQDDCYDVSDVVDVKGKDVHPGQASFFSDSYGPAQSFDYDCDNHYTKLYAEDDSSTCGTCAFDSDVNGDGVCHETTSCNVTQAANHVATFHHCTFVGPGPLCRASDPIAFHFIVDCGASEDLYACNPCSAANQPPGSTKQMLNVKQQCR